MFQVFPEIKIEITELDMQKAYQAYFEENLEKDKVSSSESMKIIKNCLTLLYSKQKQLIKVSTTKFTRVDGGKKRVILPSKDIQESIKSSTKDKSIDIEKSFSIILSVQGRANPGGLIGHSIVAYFNAEKKQLIIQDSMLDAKTSASKEDIKHFIIAMQSVIGTEFTIRYEDSIQQFSGELDCQLWSYANSQCIATGTPLISRKSKTDVSHQSYLAKTIDKIIKDVMEYNISQYLPKISALCDTIKNKCNTAKAKLAIPCMSSLINDTTAGAGRFRKDIIEHFAKAESVLAYKSINTMTTEQLESPIAFKDALETSYDKYQLAPPKHPCEEEASEDEEVAEFGSTPACTK